MVRAAVVRPRRGITVVTDRIDRVATHPFWGLLVLLAALAALFWVTYSVAGPAASALNGAVSGSFSDLLRSLLEWAPEWLSGLIVDGVVAGAGTVLSFLPILVVFFAALGLLEDVGYMARTAYVMDRYMHWMGLHGKSCMPLLLGFGCNVPAILGTRIIEERRARMLTMMLTPFVPCTGRLAVLAFLAPAFFGESAPLAVILLVGGNLVLLGLVGVSVNKLVFKGERSAFIMEMPLYHVPNARTIGLYVWRNTLAFVKKAGTLIVIVSAIVWVLSNFPGSDPVRQRAGDDRNGAGTGVRAHGPGRLAADRRVALELCGQGEQRGYPRGAVRREWDCRSGRRYVGRQGGGRAGPGRRRRLPRGADDFRALRGHGGRHPPGVELLALDRGQRGLDAGDRLPPGRGGLSGGLAVLVVAPGNGWSVGALSGPRAGSGPDFVYSGSLWTGPDGLREAHMQIYIDGEFYSKEDAKISVFDHGLLYGDGVFEGIRIYEGRVFELDPHIDRLYASAQTLALEIPLSRVDLVEAMMETIRRNEIHNGYVRLVVTRGVGDLGLNPVKCPKATVFCIADGITLYPAEVYEKGFKVATLATRRNDPQAINPAVKSLNYLNNVYGALELRGRPVNEGLFLTTAGFVCELTADNFFLLKGGKLMTPHPSLGALRGITRGVVLRLAAEYGVGDGGGLLHALRRVQRR